MSEAFYTTNESLCALATVHVIDSSPFLTVIEALCTGRVPFSAASEAIFQSPSPFLTQLNDKRVYII